MTIFSGLEIEVRMATTTTGVTTATAIPYISSLSWDINQGLMRVPKGLGYGRAQEVHEGLQTLGGSIRRTYDETLIDGVDIFADMWGSTNTGVLVEYYLEVKNTTSDKTWTFSGVRGDYTQESPGDGFVNETVDFMASTVDETT